MMERLSERKVMGWRWCEDVDKIQVWWKNREKGRESTKWVRTKPLMRKRRMRKKSTATDLLHPLSSRSFLIFRSSIHYSSIPLLVLSCTFSLLFFSFSLSLESRLYYTNFLATIQKGTRFTLTSHHPLFLPLFIHPHLIMRGTSISLFSYFLVEWGNRERRKRHRGKR